MENEKNNSSKKILIPTDLSNSEREVSLFENIVMLILTVLLGVLIAWCSVYLFACRTCNNAVELTKTNSICWGQGQNLSAKDIQNAKIAWQYIKNNFQKETGLVNSVDNYTSTTMWDTGSTLAGTIAAREIGIIEQKEFDDMVVPMLRTLRSIKLYNGKAPNKAYNTITAEMVDYGNNPVERGIGVSTLDLARLISWLNVLSCTHPKYKHAAKSILLTWDFTDLIQDGQMFGYFLNPISEKTEIVQEGRLGYEQYAGKIFALLGFDQSISATYENKFRQDINIYGIQVAYDVRDPRDLGTYNYVVTESYVLDGMENGVDKENRPLIDNIFAVQRNRWQEEGILTAVSEDNVDRKPWFIYNTIFTAGISWNTTTDTGIRHDNLKTTSTKAAYSLALFFPGEEYSDLLLSMVESAYDPERGWYSGVYEDGKGFNIARTANTNGIILQSLLYKMYGTLSNKCHLCSKNQDFYQEWQYFQKHG